MLSFNVAQLLKEGIGATREHELSGELFEVDARNPGPVKVTGHVRLIGTLKGVLAVGVAEVELVRICRRCLQLTKDKIPLEIEEEFVPTIEVVTGRALPVSEEDEKELLIDGHHVLDLTEVLRQYAVEVALAPALCSEECKGFCPVCGANLNEGPCSCDRSYVDPRMAGLAQLLEDSGQADSS